VQSDAGAVNQAAKRALRCQSTSHHYQINGGTTSRRARGLFETPNELEQASRVGHARLSKHTAKSNPRAAISCNTFIRGYLLRCHRAGSDRADSQVCRINHTPQARGVSGVTQSESPELQVTSNRSRLTGLTAQLAVACRRLTPEPSPKRAPARKQSSLRRPPVFQGCRGIPSL